MTRRRGRRTTYEARRQVNQESQLGKATLERWKWRPPSTEDGVRDVGVLHDHGGCACQDNDEAGAGKSDAPATMVPQCLLRPWLRLMTTGDKEQYCRLGSKTSNAGRANSFPKMLAHVTQE